MQRCKLEFSSVAKSEFFGADFNDYRANSGRRSRGVILAVNIKFSSKNLKSTSPILKADLIGVEVWQISQCNINILDVYISPITTMVNYEKLLDCLEMETALLYINTVIFRNFNIFHYKNFIDSSTSTTT